MSKPKHGLVGKASKASLKSRGLYVNNGRTLRPRPNSLPRACYSLYSTDSEDNIAEVNHGLDKCAELLTNILEFKTGGIDMKKSTDLVDKKRLQRPTAMLKNKKTKSACSSKSGFAKSQQSIQKIKEKKAIHIPTGETQCGGSIQNLKTAYNERVVASTPVLTAEQRRHLQELQKKEHTLKQQIQVLQEKYENLDKHSVKESSPQRTNAKQASTTEEDSNSELQGTKSSRRSLDFSQNAEKPFVDNPQFQRRSSTKIDDKDSIPNGAYCKLDQGRKVQFVANTPELQKAEGNIAVNCLELENKAPSKSTGNSGQTSKPFETEEFGKACRKRQSPQKYKDHLTILAYLVGELRAILASSGDNEVDRLLTEIENEIRVLTSYTSPRPFAGVKVKKQHDIDVEIALQPLRSENNDLRRKLRIANQRTREFEEQLQRAEENKKEHPGEGVIEHLHKQLFLERENGRHLKQKMEQAEKVITQCKKENSSLQHILTEKDEELESIQDQLRRNKSQKITDVGTSSKRQLESMEVTIRAKNKEVDLLKLTLGQRDAEIGRLTELTRGLQQSLARVLSNVQDLHPKDVLSEISMLSAIDSWKQMPERNVLPSMASTSTNVYTHQAQENVMHSDEDLDIRTLATTSNREYVNLPSSLQGRPYCRQSVEQDSVKDDADTILSVSSTDEFVFKQELANLDTMIARLQESLRRK